MSARRHSIYLERQDTDRGNEESVSHPDEFSPFPNEHSPKSSPSVAKHSAKEYQNCGPDRVYRLIRHIGRSRNRWDSPCGQTNLTPMRRDALNLFHPLRPPQKPFQLPSMLPRKPPEVPQADSFRVHAPISFHAPTQIRTAPGAEAITPRSAPQEAQH